jgi:hypothetical protein
VLLRRRVIALCTKRDKNNVPFAKDVVEPHSGNTYNEDNGNVWMLLKQLMLSCLAWTFISMIDGTRNARAAIKVQRALYKGESRRSRTKQDAYEALKLAA